MNTDIEFNYSEEKNEKLKAERGVCFEEIIEAIREGGLIDTIPHPDRAKYPHQDVLMVNMNSYIYMVPAVKEKNGFFLKTVYRSRKAKKLYLGNR